LVALITILALAAFGCGGQQQEPAETEGNGAEEPVAVGKY
jgi:hypothetical protein